MNKHLKYLIPAVIISSCSTNPYKKSEKEYNTKLKSFSEQIAVKEPEPLPIVNKVTLTIDSVYTKQLYTFKDSIFKVGSTQLKNGIHTEWISTVNFNLRKPNFIIIHHTAQDSIQQTINTFTKPYSQVSAHYVIAKDGHVVQMLNDYLRAWHAGVSSWGKNTDINSSSIGIELDNNGSEAFSEAQITSLMALLSKLKKDYNIPTQNIIGHSDIAPTRKNDPSALFPWKILAENGFGIWKDEDLPLAPLDFNPELALQIIGYNTKNLNAAIASFKLHYMPEEVNSILDQNTINTIYSIYLKQ
ncbi:MAG: N-acetylmuramoyl-L-alanine amidase [Bacteroidota bacterium]